MLSIKSSEIEPAKLYGYLSSAVAPRPICFVSTIDAAGNVNLSPYSFFNMVSTNPPVCVFSPSNTSDNQPKHALQNVVAVRECVVNVVNYSMVQQMNLASAQFNKGVNEFVKAGFTELPSVMVKPPRVAEAPVQLECRVRQIVKLGNQPNSGNLVIAEIVLTHIQDEILDADGRINQVKLDLVGRLGGSWYSRTTPESLFKVQRPVKSIGIDDLPAFIKDSELLSGNDLGLLANIEQLPAKIETEVFATRADVKVLLEKEETEIYRQAKQWISEGKIAEARLLLLSAAEDL